MKEREVWIDMLKGYGIFVVTLGHAGVNFWVEKHIYSYHMFLFFFVSGYLYKQRKIKDVVHKKVRTLLIPFIAWDIISSIVGAILNHLDLRGFVSTLLILKGNLCFNAPIWFILILFFIEILYPLVNRYISDAMLIVIAVMTFVLVGSLKLPLKMNLIPLAMFSYCSGKLYRSVKILWGDMKKWLLLLILAFVSLLFGMFLNERISYTAGIFGNYFYCLVAAFSGVHFFVLLFESLFVKCTDNNLLAYIGKNSFSIMTMQYYFFTIYNIAGKSLFGIGDLWHMENSVKAIIMTTVTIAIILMIVEVYRKLSKGNNFEIVGKIFGI